MKAKAQSSPKQLLAPAVRLNFLLGASDNDLSSFELARLAEVANLRSDLHAILDNIIDEMAQAAVAGWFRQTNRETLMRAIQSPEEHTAEILAWAKEKARNKGKSEAEIVPRTALAPGAAHLAAAVRYQKRNIAAGKCRVCPQPLARGSVQYCEEHLAVASARNKPKGAKGGPGRQSAALGALAESRQGQTDETGEGQRRGRS